MSEIKKIVKFDENNNIVVETDNAKITKDSTTSKIEGVYIIADDDVEKLLVLFNNNTTMKTISEYNVLARSYMPCTQILTSDEAVIKALSLVSKECEELREKYSDLLSKYKELNTECFELKDRHMVMRSNFDKLLEKVKKHNRYSLFKKIKLD